MSSKYAHKALQETPQVIRDASIDYGKKLVKQIDKEALLELQKIDCNCNDCIFMNRDFTTFKYWEDIKRNRELRAFEETKKESLMLAKECKDEKGKHSLIKIANKMTFMFDRSNLLNYGDCTKLNKKVSFIPGTCQIQTQECFVHRKTTNPFMKL